ncbi:hypothetical protein B0H19DRAFT_1081638 [Mycena capillaripes]|nr:hypothetical protein B0H19DRAFT_1081638 [Mycena capillaripes]
MESFLPLLGYVTMGLWCMHSWEADAMARGEEPPDWQGQIANNTNLHPLFVDLVEKSVNWDDEHVGAFIVLKILHSGFLKSRSEINMLNVSEPFQEFAPDVKELEFLTLPKGHMRFSRWGIDDNTLLWYRAPFTPASEPVAAAPLPPSDESSATNFTTAPFPQTASRRTTRQSMPSSSDEES